jgi:hypothetical protein
VALLPGNDGCRSPSADTRQGRVRLASRAGALMLCHEGQATWRRHRSQRSLWEALAAALLRTPSRVRSLD